jgi:hypothetical protein
LKNGRAKHKDEINAGEFYMRVFNKFILCLFVIGSVSFMAHAATSMPDVAELIGFRTGIDAWNQDEFKISDAPWVDNQQFSLYLSGGGNVNAHDAQTEEMPALHQYDTVMHTTNNQSDVNAKPDFNYQYQTLLCELNLVFPISIDFSTQEYLDDESAFYSSGTPYWRRDVSEETQLGASPQIDLTYYFGKYFIDSDFSATGSESYNQEKTQRRDFSRGAWQPEVVTSEVSENYQFQATQVFRAGRGRIFEGNHTFQALQLLEELSEEGQLQRPASAEDIRDLSEIIMRARRADILDSRLKIKLALKNVLDFLEKRGLILPGNTEALLTVDDIYRNVSQDQRPFGMTVNSRLGAGISVKNTEQSNFDQNGSWVEYQKDETVPQQAFAGVEFRYEVPLSRQWQLGTSASLDYAFFRYGFSDMSDTPYQIMAIGNAYADYYFNTRWKIGASAKVNLKYDTELQQDDIQVNNQPLLLHYQREYERIDFSVNAQNQLTPDFYLTVALGGKYENQTDKELYLTGEYHPATSAPTLDQINAANQTAPTALNVNWYVRLSLNYRLM